MSYSPLLLRLIDTLRCMPGVGRKSAQRIAFHLLERDRSGAGELSKALADAVEGIGHCNRCRMLTEHDICNICSASGRDDSLLCVVESPADVMAVEDATGYRGLYFVLMGHLSPLDGIGPEELGISILEGRLSDDSVKELIIATNPTVEGDATAHFLADLAGKNEVQASRIAHGVPLGGELEYVDGGTLSHAFFGRRVVD
ncbi:MAG: recombination mediator RecR [Gammaproteobacteria bacterium]|nr:recombination mediator RecR [Gammaproteobacteria bacterium]